MLVKTRYVRELEEPREIRIRVHEADARPRALFDGLDVDADKSPHRELVHRVRTLKIEDEVGVLRIRVQQVPIRRVETIPVGTDYGSLHVNEYDVLVFAESKDHGAASFPVVALERGIRAVESGSIAAEMIGKMDGAALLRHGQQRQPLSRGALIGELLDIRLLQLSGGTRGLREVINELAATYGKKRAFSEKNFFLINFYVYYLTPLGE